MCIVSVLCLSLLAIGQNCFAVRWRLRNSPTITTDYFRFCYGTSIQSKANFEKNFISKSVVEIPLRIKIEFLLSSNSNSPLSTWRRTHKKSLSTLLESNGLELYFFGALTLIQC